MTDTQQEFDFETDVAMALTFDERLPKSPMASNDLERFGLRSYPKRLALEKRFIQTNHTNLTWRIVLDVDSNLLPELVTSSGGFDFSAVGMPAPSWWVYNCDPTSPRYGCAHLGYELKAPVPRTELAKLKPLEYLASVADGLNMTLHRAGILVDFDYAGFVCKNPRYGIGTKTLACVEGEELRTYDLAELFEYATCAPKQTPRPQGFGRNVSLFHHLRFYAYAQKRHFSSGDTFHAAIRAAAESFNGTFTTPLPIAEVKATAKSVAKWVWARFDVAASDQRHQERIERTHTPEIQRLRGLKSGAVRFQGSKTAIEPWKAEGISRATWYRRQAAGK
jgi:hypothetical protein